MNGLHRQTSDDCTLYRDRKAFGNWILYYSNDLFYTEETKRNAITLKVIEEISLSSWKSPFTYAFRFHLKSEPLEITYRNKQKNRMIFPNFRKFMLKWRFLTMKWIYFLLIYLPSWLPGHVDDRLGPEIIEHCSEPFLIIT